MIPDEVSLALIKLYEKFRKPIHSYMYSLFGNQEDADDLTQEVFIHACNSWNSIYKGRHASLWLYSIATTLCIERLRRQKSPQFPTEQNSNEDSSEGSLKENNLSLLSFHVDFCDSIKKESIQQALMSIPYEYAIILILNVSQKMSYQEVAAIMGISPGTAATNIQQAKKLFLNQYHRVIADKIKTGKSTDENQ